MGCSSCSSSLVIRIITLIIHTELPFEELICAEVKGETWSISQEHALVPLHEASQALSPVNSLNLLTIFDLPCLIVLRSHLEQVEYKRDICVVKTCYRPRQCIRLVNAKRLVLLEIAESILTGPKEPNIINNNKNEYHKGKNDMRPKETFCKNKRVY